MIKFKSTLNNLTPLFLQQTAFINKKRSQTVFLDNMRSHSTSKLTTTMLTQLEQNQYLRVKLIQLQNVSRQKDNFYLSIFREQQKITEKVMSQLLLAQQKIKQFIRQRICNNWKQEYDNLSESISSYVKDVNGLIGQYQKTKQKLQQKTYKTNDLYQYYSNTLEQCGKKFDQAQIIIQQLNLKITDLKQTVSQLDEALQDKIRVIEEQNQQIDSLHNQLNNNKEISMLKQTHESDKRTIEGLHKIIKKFEKDKQAYERSIQQFEKLVNQLRIQNQQEQKKIQVYQNEIRKMSIQNENLKKQMQQVKQKVLFLAQEINVKQQQIKEQIEKSKDIRKQNVEFISMFDQHNNANILTQNNKEITNVNQFSNPIPFAQYSNKIISNQYKNIIINKSQKSELINLDQKQLHLRKILQQQQQIKKLTCQLDYTKKSIQNIQQQNKKLINYQFQYINKQNKYKKQLFDIKQINNNLLQNNNTLKQTINKLTKNIIQQKQNIKLKQQQLNNFKLYHTQYKQYQQDQKLQIQGLYQQLNYKQKQLYHYKQQIPLLQKQLQTLNKKLQNIQIINKSYQQNILLLQKNNKQSKLNFQNILHQFQSFVKQSSNQKIFQYNNIKKLSLSLCPLQVDEALIIQNNITIQKDNSKMKKKNLSIKLQSNHNQKESLKNRNLLFDKLNLQFNKPNLQENYTNLQQNNINLQQNNINLQTNKLNQIYQKQISTTRTVKYKKFNLQTFQQKTNPHINICYSPKVGEIFNGIHQARLNGTYRW